MKNKSWPIICSVLLCSTLSNGYAASDYVDAYTPGTSSKMGLLKTALIGVGLISIPRSVQANDCSPSALPKCPLIIPLGGCYLGTVDPENTKNMSYITINRLKPVPCGFYYDYSLDKYTNISLNVGMSYLFNSDDKINFNIYRANLCSAEFSLNIVTTYAPDKAYTGYIKWGYNNKYDNFHIMMLNNNNNNRDNNYCDPSYRPCFDGNSNLYDIDRNFRPNDKYLFDKTFDTFMKTGICMVPLSPRPTQMPTRKGWTPHPTSLPPSPIKFPDRTLLLGDN